MANKWKNNQVSLVINSQHIPPQSLPRRWKRYSLRENTHTHTFSPLLWNNVTVNVNFKWIPPLILRCHIPEKLKRKQWVVEKGGCLLRRDVLPDTLEPFQAIFIPGATVPSEYCYFSSVLLHNSSHPLLVFFFLSPQIEHPRLIRGGLFWDSVLVTKGCLAGHVVQYTDLLVYWLFINCS